METGKMAKMAKVCTAINSKNQEMTAEKAKLLGPGSLGIFASALIKGLAQHYRANQKRGGSVILEDSTTWRPSMHLREARCSSGKYGNHRPGNKKKQTSHCGSPQKPNIINTSTHDSRHLLLLIVKTNNLKSDSDNGNMQSAKDLFKNAKLRKKKWAVLY